MKQAKLPNLVSILILTLLTITMWISLSIYRAITSKPAPAVPQTVSQPLTPSLDVDSINKIESRLYLDDAQIPDNVVTVAPPSSAPAPTAPPVVAPVVTPVASPSAETPAPSATQSATR